MSVNIIKNHQKRVVVVGGGFAGIELVKCLTKQDFQVVLIDKNNYHQFLPLIYQVATSGLESSSISFPFRKLFHNKKNFFYRMAEVRAVNTDKKIIQTSIGKVDYDYLILAAGSVSNYFGNRNLKEQGIPMKNLVDALGVRNTLLSNFERALTCATKEERDELLRVVIVGGGATGVEIAGAIAEMKRFIFPKDYPDMDIDNLKIILVEGSDRLLAAMSVEASANAKKYLEAMGVEVRLDTRLSDYVGNTAQLNDGTVIKTRSLIWVSGVCASPIKYIEGGMLGRAGRIKVDQFNQLLGVKDVFSVGDQCIMTSDVKYPDGHPQLAQVAMQQARNLAQNLVKMQRGDAMKPFVYKNKGSMATIGRKRAVADIGSVKMGGRLAWFMWLVVHLKSILGVKNKIFVLIDWMWNYFSFDRSSRFILYPRKNYVIKEREEKEELTHLGEDLFDDIK